MATNGIYTGAYKDCDSSYINAGMFGEGVCTNNVIVMTIHFPPPNWKLPTKLFTSLEILLILSLLTETGSIQC